MAQERSKSVHGHIEARYSCSVICVQTYGPESLRLLRREAPRKASTGGREFVPVTGKESLVVDIPDLDVEKAIEIAGDEEE